MGNVLWCCCCREEEEDDGYYPYYNPPSISTSRPPPLPHYRRYHDDDDHEPAAATPPARPTPSPRLHYNRSNLADLRIPLPPRAASPPRRRQSPPAGMDSLIAVAYPHCRQPLLQLQSGSSGMIWDDDTPPAAAAPATSRPPQQPLDQRPHGGVPALEYDLRCFEQTSKVPKGLGEHVISSKKAQVKWYRNVLEAYNNTKPPPKTSTAAAKLVASVLSNIQKANLEGVLAFYDFAIQTTPIVTSKHHPSSLPVGVKFMLNTLPVNAKCIGDGDGFTAYVDTVDLVESEEVPFEEREAIIAMIQACKSGNNKTKKMSQTKLHKVGYRIIHTLEDEILAKQYRFRLRGIDAPEIGMDYGEESKNALVNLISSKRIMVHVYGQDRYGRYVGDIHCDGVFIQEELLKEGHVWHYKTYDTRPKFAKLEKQARDACRGLWANGNPEKPWEWRRKNRRCTTPH